MAKIHRANTNGSISLTVPKLVSTLMQLEPGQEIDFQLLDINNLVVTRATPLEKRSLDRVIDMIDELQKSSKSINELTNLTEMDKRNIIKRQLLEISRGV